MGRPPKSASKPSAVSAAASQPVAQKPEMKYSEAAHLADKTSRTMSKIAFLLNVLNEPGIESGDPHGVIDKYVQRLNKRLNRRLMRLAKWSDSSLEERQTEFRHMQRLPGAFRQLPFSKPPAPPTASAVSLAGVPRTPSPYMHVAAHAMPQTRPLYAAPQATPQTVSRIVPASPVVATPSVLPPFVPPSPAVAPITHARVFPSSTVVPPSPAVVPPTPAVVPHTPLPVAVSSVPSPMGTSPGVVESKE